VFGLVGAIMCNIAVSLKPICFYDDALDVFAVHGIGGITGNLLTGVFAQKYYANGIDGGGLDGNWIQVVSCDLIYFSWSIIN
jgi:Amt family ammonium transporter